MKNRNGHKMGKENQHEERQGRDRSEGGFWFEKLSVKKALPLALVLAMVFSIVVVAVSGGLPTVHIYPTVLQCSVSPDKGNYTDTFTYYLSIISPKTATITLEIYQPANNTWEVKDEKNQTWIYDEPKEIENHTFTITPFINMSQGGISSYRFKYDDGPVTSAHYPGPYLPPQVNVNSSVKFFPITPNSSDEAFYDLGDTTAFNYKVNATSNVDRWFDITLKVYDPEEGKWELKGESTLVYLKAGENKTLEWGNIKPFESLKSDNSIQNRIGDNSIFTFVYSGNKAGNFTGPKLVRAFKGLKIKPEVIRWGDDFTYSISVIACKNLSITLQYCNKTQCNETEWINANKTEPTKDYTTPYKWKKLTWNCKATDSWDDVRFVEEDIIGGASVEMTSLELGMGISQLSASKPRGNYPVPVIVKVKEEK